MKNPKIKYFGILNLTPDSFSDGSQEIFNSGKALTKAFDLIESGMDVIDVGAESTRPGATPISAAEEQKRLIPFLLEFCKISSHPLSIDSHKAETLNLVLNNPEFRKNIHYINDVTGLHNAALAKLIGEAIAKEPESKLEIIVMHSKGGIPPPASKTVPDDFYSYEAENRQEALLKDMIKFFEHSIDIAAAYGIGPERLVLDPGLGFGKNLNHSLDVLDLIPRLKKRFGLAVFIGASRKSFLRDWKPAEALDEASAEYHALAIKQGADILRCHI